MKKLLLVIVLALSMSGCTIIPLYTFGKACELVNIASLEGDLAAGWYVKAGQVLEACGYEDAAERTIENVCNAQKRSGYECN